MAAGQSLEPVIVYIDGFNLYFGLRARGWRRYYWLNPIKLSLSLMRSSQALVGVKYFTSRVTIGRDTIARQNEYLDALSSLSELEVHFGKYLLKPSRCRVCGVYSQVAEEKMTDVNIASEMLVDAFTDRCRTALLVSADSDLTAPVRSIRQHHPQNKVIIAFPPRRHSISLHSIAHGVLHIGSSELRRSQFENHVKLPDGRIVRRPVSWR